MQTAPRRMAGTPMNDSSDTGKAEIKHLGGELILPVAAFLFTLYYFWTIVDVPWTAQVSAFFVGTILIVLIGIFIIKSVGELKSGKADLGMGRLIAPRAFIPKRLALIGLTLGFIIFVEHLGFTITAFLFLSCAILLLGNGRNKVLAVSLSTVLALSGWALFIWAFETRFPAGPFENLMQGLL